MKVDLTEQEIEANINKIIKVIKTTDCGIITAFRGNFSYEENLRRNEILKSQLDKLNYDYYPVVGHWMEIPSDKQQLPIGKLSKEDFVDLSENSFVVVKPDWIEPILFFSELHRLMTIDGATQDCVIIHGRPSKRGEKPSRLHGDLVSGFNPNHAGEELPNIKTDVPIDINGKFFFMNSDFNIAPDNRKNIKFAIAGNRVTVGKGGDNTSRGFTSITQKGKDGYPNKDMNFTIECESMYSFSDFCRQDDLIVNNKIIESLTDANGTQMIDEAVPLIFPLIGKLAMWASVAIVGGLAVRGCTNNIEKAIDDVGDGAKQMTDNPSVISGIISAIIVGLANGLGDGFGIDIKGFIAFIFKHPIYSTTIASLLGISVYALKRLIPKIIDKAEEYFSLNKKPNVSPEAQQKIEVAVDAIGNGSITPDDVLKMSPEDFKPNDLNLESLLENIKTR